MVMFKKYKFKTLRNKTRKLNEANHIFSTILIKQYIFLCSVIMICDYDYKITLSYK